MDLCGNIYIWMLVRDWCHVWHNWAEDESLPPQQTVPIYPPAGPTFGGLTDGACINTVKVSVLELPQVGRTSTSNNEPPCLYSKPRSQFMTKPLLFCEESSMADMAPHKDPVLLSLQFPTPLISGVPNSAKTRTAVDIQCHRCQTMCRSRGYQSGSPARWSVPQSCRLSPSSTLSLCMFHGEFHQHQVEVWEMLGSCQVKHGKT